MYDLRSGSNLSDTVFYVVEAILYSIPLFLIQFLYAI